MGDSYEKVKESERVEGIRERARIIVEAEKRFPKSHRYHRFMHFVEVVDSTSKLQHVAWEGVTRRVTEVVATRSDRLDGELSQMKSVQVETNNKLELQLGELAQMKSELAQMKSENSEITNKLELILDKLK